MTSPPYVPIQCGLHDELLDAAAKQDLPFMPGIATPTEASTPRPRSRAEYRIVWPFGANVGLSSNRPVVRIKLWPVAMSR